MGTSRVAQWLRFHSSTGGGVSSVPGQGINMPHFLTKKVKAHKITMLEIKIKILNVCLFIKKQIKYILT